MNILNQNGGSKTETLIKLVLIFVISLLSFSVGTFVGKQFSDSQYKMASIEDEFAKPNRDIASKSDGDVLTDADIASLTEEFINAEKESIDKNAAKSKEDLKDQAENHAKDHSVDGKKDSHHGTAKKGHVHITSKIDAVAGRVAKGQTPTKTPVKKVKVRVPTSLPTVLSSSNIGKFTLQIAAYSSESEARKHTKKLLDMGFSSFFLVARIKDKTWYRVNVGLFGSVKEAKIYSVTFKKQANVSSAFIKRIEKN